MGKSRGGIKMSEVLKEMKERRSIRKYKADMVPQEILDQIIEAGLYAASGKGTQNTIIIQVNTQGIRGALISSLYSTEYMLFSAVLYTVLALLLC